MHAREEYERRLAVLRALVQTISELAADLRARQAESRRPLHERQHLIDSSRDAVAGAKRRLHDHR